MEASSSSRTCFCLTPSAPPIRLHDTHCGDCLGPSGGEQTPRLTTVCDKSGSFGHSIPVLRCRAFLRQLTVPSPQEGGTKVRTLFAYLMEAGTFGRCPRLARTFPVASTTSAAKLELSPSDQKRTVSPLAQPPTPPSSNSLPTQTVFSHRVLAHGTRSIRCPTSHPSSVHRYTSSPWNEREEKPRNEAQRRYNDDGDQVVQMTNYPNVFRGLVWPCHDIRRTWPQPKKRRQQSHGCAVPRVDMPYEASQLLPVSISYYSSFPPGTRKDNGRPLAGHRPHRPQAAEQTAPHGRDHLANP
ncbi:hypothetical protein CMEL01_01454 [Colletotrichum melonis]|uniref:Uncharacterized protein n=1 Tax=Colletotrichum melonis TaxID=1209925 RepID=A0AAI9V6K4_9PEZI|nr:hypothetical protein CMEL01_01454 [Colletotrichum melonis]